MTFIETFFEAIGIITCMVLVVVIVLCAVIGFIELFFRK